MMAAEEFIIHRLVLDLNHLDRVCKDLRSKNYLAFEDEAKFFYGITFLC